MPAQMRHEIDEIVARMLYGNAALGSDPLPWQTYFDGKGTAPSTTWPVFAGGEPDTPDNVITTYHTSPEFQAKVMTGETQELKGFTIRVRGKSKAIAARKALDIKHWLDFTAVDQQVTIDGQQYLIPSVPRCTLVPLPRMPQALGRWLFNLNCQAVVLAYPITG